MAALEALFSHGNASTELTGCLNVQIKQMPDATYFESIDMVFAFVATIFDRIKGIDKLLPLTSLHTKFQAHASITINNRRENESCFKILESVILNGVSFTGTVNNKL